MNNTDKIKKFLINMFWILIWLLLGLAVIGAVVFVIYFWAVILAFGLCCVVILGVLVFIVKLLTG